MRDDARLTGSPDDADVFLHRSRAWELPRLDAQDRFLHFASSAMP
jgi:hypothetical protein